MKGAKDRKSFSIRGSDSPAVDYKKEKAGKLFSPRLWAKNGISNRCKTDYTNFFHILSLKGIRLT